MKHIVMLGLSVAIFGSGCSLHARSPDDYRKVTRETLATRKSEVRQCYKKLADGDEALSGNVVVKFDVEPKTGKIVNAKVVEESSDAPGNLQECVLTSLEGLAIDPPDLRKGDATFTYEFESK